MIILTIRTDKPEAEIGLFSGDNQLGYETWQAHRQLAETLHIKIQSLLQAAGMGWSDVNGIICFKGPGSFTGLRIGLTVGNALATSLNIPVVSTGGEVWLERGIKKMLAGENEEVAMPEYGGEVFTTQPRK